MTKNQFKYLFFIITLTTLRNIFLLKIDFSIYRDVIEDFSFSEEQYLFSYLVLYGFYGSDLLFLPSPQTFKIGPKWLYI